VTINRFQFNPVHNAVDPFAVPQLHEDEDPRETDPLFVHGGYEIRIPGEANAQRYYVHSMTGRTLTGDQYKSETKMLDRLYDEHYHPAEDE